MSNVFQINDSPKHPRRRRSTSLDSKVIISYRENKIPENQMKQHASSNNILYNSENVELEKSNNQKTKKLNTDSYFLFVNWYKDFKSVKPPLINLSDSNIFKNEFPRHNDLNHKENNPPLVFLVCNNMKIDNEYEAYYIKDYEDKLKELITWSEAENKEIFDEYSRGLDLIDSQALEEAKPFGDKNEDTEPTGEKKSNARRFSETTALIMQNKNQAMQTFLPREHQGVLQSIRFTSELEVIYLSLDKKIDKNYKTNPRVGVLTNFEIYLFTRNNYKLKDSYTLRHIYLGHCNDTQIANIDSCLRIGGPFGNDMIIRFPNPQSRNEWNKFINDHIVTYQESLKHITATITIFNDTNPPSSVPLVCKTITINGNTVGLDLKKMAVGVFEMKDVEIKDLSIMFLIKNKENFLHDDVSLIVLQEHVNNIQENNCVKSCMDGDKMNAMVKIIYYLRYNRSLTDNSIVKDLGKIKKMINPKLKEEIKAKQNKYNIDIKWVDNKIPNWLMNLLADLYNEGSKCEGIFRMSGVVVQSDEYINQICETEDVKIEASIYTKASILKKFISIIEGSLLTSITRDQFIILSNDIISVEEFLVQEEQQSRLVGFIQKIPPNHLNLFQHILVVLKHIIENSHLNQMNHTSLATCFSQNLFKHLSDEAVKINKLFECILHLINQIVNPSIYSSIVMAFEKRKSSVESEESHPKSDICLNCDVGSNSPNTPRTASESPDEGKHSISSTQPVVPLRRKKAAAKNKQIESDSSCLNDDRTNTSTNINQQKNHPSLIDKLTTDTENKIKFDETDSRASKSNKIGEMKYQMKTCSNLISKENKIQRSHNTFNTGSVTPESNHTNFQRQNQVNRKHQKINSNTDSSTSQVEAKPKTNDNNQTKTRLTRSTDRVIPKLRSRSQTKLAETAPGASSNESRQPMKTAYQYNVESFLSGSYDSRRDFVDRKRSSSACRVPKLKEQYESISQKPPPLPLKKSAYLSESQNVSKLIKDIEENRVSRSRNPIRPHRSRNPPNGPIRSTQVVSMIYAQDKSKSQASPSYFSQKSLTERLYDSNDDDVTFI